jgi:hypothetical protein
MARTGDGAAVLPLDMVGSRDDELEAMRIEADAHMVCLLARDVHYCSGT